MTILHLEDRYSVSYYLKEQMEGMGHIVIECYSVNDARSAWENEKVDCIIADLNLDPEGLTSEEINQTKNGKITGWIWLSNYVFKKTGNSKSSYETSGQIDIRDFTILYSEYIDVIKNSVSKETLNGIVLIHKRGSASPVNELLKTIDRFEKKLGVL